MGFCGIGATIGSGREMLCLPYAGFFFPRLTKPNKLKHFRKTDDWMQLWYITSSWLTFLIKIQFPDTVDLGRGERRNKKEEEKKSSFFHLHI